MLTQLGLHQAMELRVSATQVLLSELTLLPVLDLEQRIHAELETNAALELPVPPSCPGCGHPVWSGACLRCDRWSPRRQRGPDDPADRRDGPAGLAATPATRDLLLTDAAPALRPAERAVAAHLLADTDDLGLLVEPVAAVAERLGVTERTVRRVIEALRQSGRPGLCATTLTERLRLQVCAAADGRAAPAGVATLLARGLDALADGGVGAAAAATGLRPAELRSAVAWIRAHVEAEPIEPAAAAPPPPVDLVIRRDGDELLIDVVPGPWSAVRVAESYLAVAADPRVRPDVLRARRFVDVLDRRARTILRVAGVVIARQARRMTEGPAAHRPLVRRDVAAALDLHESTVSRVVAGKHVLLPSGETVEFGALFGGARGAQECLRELMAAETVASCDARLADALAERGYRVSRRTVAKYRAALGIAGRHRR
jgi:RNA polymerase sigma-54 factor